MHPLSTHACLLKQKVLATEDVLQVFAFVIISRLNSVSVNKQLLDEVEHDIMNYQNRGLCYLPKPKAEADNTDTRF